MSDVFNPATAQLADAGATPFDPKTAQPAEEKAGGYLPNFAAGFGEGVTGGLDMLDKVVNPYRTVAELFNRGSPLVGGKDAPKMPVMDQKFLNHMLGKIGLDPDSVEARTFGERLSRYGGQGASAILVPGAGEAGVGAAAARAATGAVARMAGGTASEYVPDFLKPVVSLFASLAAGIPFSMGLTAAGRVPGQVKTASTLARAGASNDVAEEVAGSVIAKNATDPAKVKDMLATRDAVKELAVRTGGKDVTELVPGSEPTTFQATGDMGLGALERSAAVKNPELFRQREAEQNAARLEALGGVQKDASPTAVADFFRKQLGDLDQRTATNIEDRLDLARKATAQAGGDVTPEGLGATMRDAVASAEAKARTDERGLWKAVDPDGTLTGNVKDTSSKAQSIVDAMRKTEKPMEGEEAAVFKAAGELPDVAPVSDLIALRSRVSTAMRDELTTSGRTPSYARLVTLRGAIQDNLAKTISDVAAKEMPAAADGSITSRVAQWRQGLEAERDAFLAQRAAGGGGGTVSSGARPQVQAPGPAGETPTFDAAAADRLTSATAATKERAGTFGTGPVGQVLRTAGQSNVFRLADAGVPGKFFHGGPTAFQDAKSFLDANRPSAGFFGPDRGVAILTDAAAQSLRRAAMTEEGILDPRRVMIWQNKYQDALRALPPEIHDQFMNARNAGQAVAEAQLARTEAMAAFRKGQVGQLLGVTDPSEVTNIIGRTLASLQSATLMKGLVDAVKSDPDAAAGLRQAVADHISKEFIGNTEVATSGQGGIKADAFQTFVKTNEPALRQVFGPANMDTMKAIAEDIRQASRSQNAVRLPGGSNTAQDTYAVGKQTSMLTKLLIDAGVGFAATHTGPIGMFSAALGAHSMQALRDAGIANVDQLVTKAMLDPVLARRLLNKAPAATMAPAQDLLLAKAIRRGLAVAAITANARKNGTAP